jgi:hypothetical protein
MRRADPANQERLRVLEEYENSASNGPLPVEAILEAFMYPTFRMAADPNQGGETFVRFLGRLQAESDLLPTIVFSRFGPVLLRFADALARALPELPQNELFLRARLAMGATAQLLLDAPRITQEDATPDWESLLQRLIPFLSAGFRAPLECPRYQTAVSTQENG